MPELLDIELDIKKSQPQLKIHELITEDTWIKGDYTRFHNGKECHCTVGWMLKVYANTDDYSEQFAKLDKYISDNYPNYHHYVSKWNDNPHRTYNEVYTVFKECNL